MKGSRQVKQRPFRQNVVRLFNVHAEDPVFFSKVNSFANEIMSLIQELARSQRLPEIKSLGRAQKLNGKDIFQVFDDAERLSAPNGSHADMVFLPQRGWDAIGA
jgi:hypothetical protein